MNLKSIHEMREVANSSLLEGVSNILTRLEEHVRAGETQVELDLYQVVSDNLNPEKLKEYLESLGYTVWYTTYQSEHPYVEFGVSIEESHS